MGDGPVVERVLDKLQEYLYDNLPPDEDFIIQLQNSGTINKDTARKLRALARNGDRSCIRDLITHLQEHGEEATLDKFCTSLEKYGKKGRPRMVTVAAKIREELKALGSPPSQATLPSQLAPPTQPTLPSLYQHREVRDERDFGGEVNEPGPSGSKRSQLHSDDQYSQPKRPYSTTKDPTAPRAGMDEKIGSCIDILGKPAYKKGLINNMATLGLVLGIEEETQAILNRNGTIDAQLLEILRRYINETSPTWRNFCTALEKNTLFKDVREKIEADHNSSKANEREHPGSKRSQPPSDDQQLPSIRPHSIQQEDKPLSQIKKVQAIVRLYFEGELFMPRNEDLEIEFAYIMGDLNVALDPHTISRQEKRRIQGAVGRMYTSIAKRIVPQPSSDPDRDNLFAFIDEHSNPCDPLLVNIAINVLDEHEELKKRFTKYKEDLKAWLDIRIANFPRTAIVLPDLSSESCLAMCTSASEDQVLLAYIIELHGYLKRFLQLDCSRLLGMQIGCTIVYFSISAVDANLLRPRILSHLAELKEKFSLSYIVLIDHFVVDVESGDFEVLQLSASMIQPREDFHIETEEPKGIVEALALQLSETNLERHQTPDQLDDVDVQAESDLLKDKIAELEPQELERPLSETSDRQKAAPKAGMDEKIDFCIDILGNNEYKKGLIGKMPMLGTVLGIGDETDAILKSGDIKDQLRKILKYYIDVNSPTWRDFCTALKKHSDFNKIREKIEADHNSGQIKSICDLLPFLESMLPHLGRLGPALGIPDYATAIIGGPKSNPDKCQDILQYWLDCTPAATLDLLCEKLSEVQCFARVVAKMQEAQQ